MQLYNIIEIATGNPVGDILIESEGQVEILSQTHYLRSAENNLDLAGLKNYYIKALDDFTGQVRKRYISGGEGQQMTYLLKADEAKTFAAAGYVGTETEFPFVFREASITNVTPQVMADTIIAKAAALNDVGSMIEAQRARGHLQITNAVDAVEAKVKFDYAVASVGVYTGA